jgi:hypothetical protein
MDIWKNLVVYVHTYDIAKPSSGAPLVLCKVTNR